MDPQFGSRAGAPTDESTTAAGSSSSHSWACCTIFRAARVMAVLTLQAVTSVGHGVRPPRRTSCQAAPQVSDGDVFGRWRRRAAATGLFPAAPRRGVHVSHLSPRLQKGAFACGLLAFTLARFLERPTHRRLPALLRQIRQRRLILLQSSAGDEAKDAATTVTGEAAVVLAEEVITQGGRAVPELLGVPMTSDYMAVGLVYFAQGALGLAALAKPFLLKDELHLAPAEAQLLLSVTYWPWVLKPIWGFITDSFPILGSRRRAYLVLAGLLSSVGWLGLGLGAGAGAKEVAVLLMMLGNFGIAVGDVVVDGLVVEKARGDDRLMGSLQSFSWSSRAVGAIISAYFSGALLEAWGVKPVFLLTAGLPALVAGAALLIREPEEQRQLDATSSDSDAKKTGLEEAMQQVSELWKLVTSPEILLPVLFIASWQATPNSGSAMFYYYTNELHLSAEFLGRTQLAGAVATLAGTVLYNRVFAGMGLRDYLLRVNLAAVALGLLPLALVTHANLALGIPDQAFVLGDDVIQTVAGELAHMPILVLAARLCPPGVEATLFALLMSILNFSGFIATLIGSTLTDFLHVTETDFGNLALLVAVCNATGLLPLALLRFVPEGPPASADKNTSSESTVRA